MAYSDLKVCDDGDVLVPTKGFLAQLLCQHNYHSFEKPWDPKTNPCHFMSLNGPETIEVCIKYGKHKR